MSGNKLQICQCLLFRTEIWRGVNGQLVPDVSRQRDGLVFKGGMSKCSHSTLEGEITVLSRNVGHRHPMIQRQYPEGLKHHITDQ